MYLRFILVLFSCLLFLSNFNLWKFSFNLFCFVFILFLNKLKLSVSCLTFTSFVFSVVFLIRICLCHNIISLFLILQRITKPRMLEIHSDLYNFLANSRKVLLNHFNLKVFSLLKNGLTNELEHVHCNAYQVLCHNFLLFFQPAEKLGEDVLVTPGLQKEILTFDIPVNDTGSAGLGMV